MPCLILKIPHLDKGRFEVWLVILSKDSNTAEQYHLLLNIPCIYNYFYDPLGRRPQGYRNN